MAQTVSPKSASWLLKNKEHLSGEREIRKMFRAHEDAVDDGLKTDSDEYFSFIESRLRLNKQVEEDVMSEAAAPAPRRAPQPPPAPVSRSPQRSNVVSLTKDQAEMASMLGMTDKEYAKHMLDLRKEGKIAN